MICNTTVVSVLIVLLGVCVVSASSPYITVKKFEISDALQGLWKTQMISTSVNMGYVNISYVSSHCDASCTNTH
jgi:energy-converting hydrogenase Eha subunit C